MSQKMWLVKKKPHYSMATSAKHRSTFAAFIGKCVISEKNKNKVKMNLELLSMTS